MSVWISDEKLLIFASLISPSKRFCLRRNIKHSTQCFITRWNTSKFVKNTPLRVIFSTLFSVFHLVIKHCILCLIYYLTPQKGWNWKINSPHAGSLFPAALWLCPLNFPPTRTSEPVPDTSSFHLRIHCMQFGSYDTCSSMSSP